MESIAKVVDNVEDVKNYKVRTTTLRLGERH